MKVLVVLTSILLMACAPVKLNIRTSEFPALNDPYVLPEYPCHFLIDHNLFVLGDTCNKGGINWTLAVNNKHKIIYLETMDKNFTTPEGVSLRSNLGDILKVGGTVPTLEYGSVYKSKLPSGWYVSFVYGNGVLGEVVPKSEHPSWFCRQIEN